MSQRIQDIPEEDRPRERLLRLGPEALSDAELIGLFINTGVKGENAIQIAQRMLSEFGGLRNFSRRSTAQLAESHGVGPAKAALLAAALELGKRAAREAVRELPMDRPDRIFDYIGLEMQALNQEELHLLSLDTRLNLVHHDRIFRGTLNETSAHPREIMRMALLRNAASFIIVHNHPSGDPSASDADRRFTRTLNEASQIMRIHMVDHLIIGHPSLTRPQPWYSFRESGLLM